MSAKPTPGPLIVRVGANGDVGIIATSQAVEGADQIGGALVAECFAEIRRAGEGARAEALANATLFASARPLLDAVQELIAAEAAEGRAMGGFVNKPATRAHQQRLFAAWQGVHAIAAKLADITQAPAERATASKAITRRSP